ncbi:MAG: hypothetical protein HOE90_13350 [Bacteriovoracaceae bacterium]|nr:hypothetical protein [Bacteriovoracaceae bacterium]
MGHYEKRLEADLKKVSDSVFQIGELVLNSYECAIQALLDGNHDLSYETIIGDRLVNREVKELDKICLQFIATHLPSGKHLRFVSSAMRAGIELERIGDYASTICRETVQLSRAPHKGAISDEIKRMGVLSKKALKNALIAFKEKDGKKAEKTIDTSKNASTNFDTFFEDLIDNENWEKKDQFTFLIIFYMLLRVSDQARNICTETVFFLTGEGKPEKIYKILFTDQSNSSLSQLTMAIAQKKYNGCGHFESAGKNPGKHVDPNLISFLNDRGIKNDKLIPKGFDGMERELADFYIIVGLEGPVKDTVGSVPFHTIPLQWNVGEAPMADLSSEDACQKYENLYRSISLELQDLMNRLCGPSENCCGES